MDERKRTRCCLHSKEEVSYAVYKRHKKSYTMLERMNGLRGHVSSADVHMKEMDAADDEKMCNALASSHKGIPRRVSFLGIHYQKW